MVLDEVPPKYAHYLLMRIYDYMQQEKRAPATNIIKHSIGVIDEDFRSAVQWLVSRGLIYAKQNPAENQLTFYPSKPRYKYFMDLLTVLEMDFLFRAPLLEVIWERDIPVC
ncbi:MAG: hypothetical protein ACFFAE_08735 [Candidatus Hodarchaeota archaeon]